MWSPRNELDKPQQLFPAQGETQGLEERYGKISTYLSLQPSPEGQWRLAKLTGNLDAQPHSLHGTRICTPSPTSHSPLEPERWGDSSTHFLIFKILSLPTQSDSLDQGQSSTANISVSSPRNTEVPSS